MPPEQLDRLLRALYRVDGPPLPDAAVTTVLVCDLRAILQKVIDGDPEDRPEAD